MLPAVRVVSIVKANQVKTLLAQGQCQAAQWASDDVKKWAIISAACGVLVVYRSLSWS